MSSKISSPGQYSGYTEKQYSGYVRHSLYVPVSDGTKLAVDYFIPMRDGEETKDKLPVIVQFTPYGRLQYDKQGNPSTTVRLSGKGSDDPDYFTDYGYVYALVDVRGCGASYGCRVTTNSRREAQDNAELVEWFAAQDFCDGKVGTVGYSYVGQTQLETVSMKPKHLVASFIGMTDFDKYDGWLRDGVPRAFGSQPDIQWKAIGGNVEVEDVAKRTVPVEGDTDRHQLIEAITEHIGSLSQIKIFQTMLCRDSYLEEAGIHIWKEISSSTYKKDINESGVAIYSVGGNFDVFRRDTFITYKNVTNPKKLLLGPWYHHCPRIDFPWVVEQRRWFDYWLKGIDNGIMNEDPITVKVAQYDFENDKYQGPGTGTVLTAKDWPVSEGSRKTLYLTDKNKLISDAAECGDSIDYDVRYGIKTHCESPFTTDAEGNGVDQKGLVFESDNLSYNQTFIGHPMLYLSFSIEDPGWMTSDLDLDVFATLSDYDPKSGKSFLVSDGHLRTSFRKEDECPYDFLGLPWHACLEGTHEYLALHKKYDIKIDLMPLAYTFAKGHRLRLTLSNSFGQMYYYGFDKYETDKNIKPPKVRYYFNDGSAKIELPNIYD